MLTGADITVMIAVVSIIIVIAIVVVAIERYVRYRRPKDRVVWLEEGGVQHQTYVDGSWRKQKNYASVDQAENAILVKYAGEPTNGIAAVYDCRGRVID